MINLFYQIFKSRIQMYARIIKHGVGESYKDIATSAIPTKEEALERAGGTKHEAARLLGVSRYVLKRHMRKLGVRYRPTS